MLVHANMDTIYIRQVGFEPFILILIAIQGVLRPVNFFHVVHR